MIRPGVWIVVDRKSLCSAVSVFSLTGADSSPPVPAASHIPEHRSSAVRISSRPEWAQ